MKHIQEEVFIVQEIDVAVVGKEPIRRPWIEDDESVPGINELRLAGHYRSGIDDLGMEGMPSSEAGLELGIRNASALAYWT